MNDELGDDEAFVMFVGAIGTVIATAFWYVPLASRWPRLRPARAGIRGSLAVAPPALLGALWLFLRRAAARDVRGDVRYQILFVLVGAVVLALGRVVARLFGLHIRTDALERDNPAVAVAAIGAAFSAIVAYAGANIGEGATIWTTLAPAAMALVGLLFAWVVHESIAHAWEAITIDRDVASAWRLGGALTGAGLILGCAAAGNWSGTRDAMDDLISRGWPALCVVIAAAIVHRALRPTPTTPRPALLACGILPAASFVILATICVALLNSFPTLP